MREQTNTNFVKHPDVLRNLSSHTWLKDTSTQHLVFPAVSAQGKMNQIFRTGREYFGFNSDSIQHHLLHIMYLTPLCPGSHPLTHLWSRCWGGRRCHAGSNAPPCWHVSLWAHACISHIHSDAQCWLVCFYSASPHEQPRNHGVIQRGNSQQWGTLLLLLGRWVKSPWRHSGYSSEMPGRMQSQEPMATSPRAHPAVGFSSDEEIEASKRLNKYLTPMNKSTRIQSQDPPCSPLPSVPVAETEEDWHKCNPLLSVCSLKA